MVASKGFHKNKICLSTKRNVVITYSPEVRCRTSPSAYYFYYLMKHKVWNVCPQSLYGGTSQSNLTNDLLNGNIQQILNDSWLHEFGDLTPEQRPEFIPAFIHDVRDDDDNNERTPNLQSDALERMDIDAYNMDGDFVSLCRSILILGYNFNAIEQYEDMAEWNKNHNWSITDQNYMSLVLSKFFLNIWDRVLTVPGKEIEVRQQRYRRDLNEQQSIAFDLITNAIDNRLYPSLERCFLLIGGAGCGKSYVIDALVTELGDSCVIKAAFSGMKLV